VKELKNKEASVLLLPSQHYLLSASSF